MGRPAKGVRPPRGMRIAESVAYAFAMRGIMVDTRDIYGKRIVMRLDRVSGVTEVLHDGASHVFTREQAADAWMFYTGLLDEGQPELV